MSLTDYAESYERLKLMTLEYTNVSEGSFREEPVVELFCRDSDGNRKRVNVHGYYPHFYVTEDEFVSMQDDLLNERRIRYIEVDERLLSEEQKLDSVLHPTDGPPRTTLDGRDLVKIYTVVPGDVADLREKFNEHWEADVFFTNRFLIDTDIEIGLEVPADDWDESEGAFETSVEDVSPLGPEETPDVRPRMLTVDIEVWTGGEFPDTQDPSKPVTAITAHDSYDDEYFCAVLHPDAVGEGDGHSWDSASIEWETPDGVRPDQFYHYDASADDPSPVRVYAKETHLLAGFNNFVMEKDPDLLTGWNSSRNDIGSGFDYPYLINRADRINEWSYRDLSYDNGRSFVTNRGSAVIEGREMFDMLQAYKKTQIHEKRSYSLGYIANAELGYGKEDLADLDEGWLHDPADFVRYNIRDTQAVHEIEREKSVLDMYDHIRSIAGATYSEIADSNIGIIDVLFLRQAKEKNYALPTSERPDVQHYWGAYVFPPEPGKHSNVVYPDLSSLYPNLFRDMNASPETIIGDEADLRESEYSKEDCHTIYVDPRSEEAKKEADEPERTEMYVLKPEVKESFVREIVEDLIDMKYEYKKDRYSDEAYEAVKRITNSVYGVMGDSKSYGKGFRLFDWRIAEAITLAGRDVIKHTAETFADRVRSMGYPDARIIAGDTDSCVCTIPDAGGMESCLEIAHEAAEFVNSTYADYMLDRFGIEDGNMAVEIESHAEAALFMDAKKRYAQWIRWDEGEYVDEIEHKGFELVRSDSAEITAEAQTGVLERVLREDDPKGAVRDYLSGQWQAATSGDIDHESIGIPSAINNDIMDYGWSEDDETGEIKYYTPQPHVRGARYAKCYVDGEDPGQGDKPLMFYVSGIDPTCDMPETYSYEDELSLNAPSSKPDANRREMKEIGRRVDAIAVNDVRNLTEEVWIDYEKMAEKTIRDPVGPIVEVMGWSFQDLVTEGEQTGLAQFM